RECGTPATGAEVDEPAVSFGRLGEVGEGGERLREVPLDHFGGGAGADERQPAAPAPQLLVVSDEAVDRLAGKGLGRPRLDGGGELGGGDGGEGDAHRVPRGTAGGLSPARRGGQRLQAARRAAAADLRGGVRGAAAQRARPFLAEAAAVEVEAAGGE